MILRSDSNFLADKLVFFSFRKTFRCHEIKDQVIAIRFKWFPSMFNTSGERAEVLPVDVKHDLS